jgi:hypothetical protein
MLASLEMLKDEEYRNCLALYGCEMYRPAATLYYNDQTLVQWAESTEVFGEDGVVLGFVQGRNRQLLCVGLYASFFVGRRCHYRFSLCCGTCHCQASLPLPRIVAYTTDSC